MGKCAFLFSFKIGKYLKLIEESFWNSETMNTVFDWILETLKGWAHHVLHGWRQNPENVSQRDFSLNTDHRTV